MPTPEQVRTYQQKQAENMAKQEARAHVLSILSTHDIAKKVYPPKNWFVNSLIPQGLTTIAGQSKVGKSWMLMQIALAISSGGIVFGNLRCQRADVLYLAREDEPVSIQERMKYMAAKPNRDCYVDDTTKIVLSNLEMYLDEMPTIQVVIIDTMVRFLADQNINYNSYGEVDKVAGILKEIAKKREISIIACTHTKKGAKAEEGIDGVMGSKALVAVSDAVLMLTRPWDKEKNSYGYEGSMYVTGRSVRERTIELERTENWLWLDKNAEKPPTSLEEFNNFE